MPNQSSTRLMETG